MTFHATDNLSEIFLLSKELSPSYQRDYSASLLKFLHQGISNFANYNTDDLFWQVFIWIINAQ
ncbi:MAG: hypothetical protein CO189_08500 [candidate division Zixibacteria bacterium CG_4_9_14_3_um_filter_46_8]|nr:MAG: hypothetical protein CO189_08500 [candidate division Zixibacteria bacterium CG_4_9_14_3_um_filter_46_8]